MDLAFQNLNTELYSARLHITFAAPATPFSASPVCSQLQLQDDVSFVWLLSKYGSAFSTHLQILVQDDKPLDLAFFREKLRLKRFNEDSLQEFQEVVDAYVQDDELARWGDLQRLCNKLVNFSEVVKEFQRGG